MTYAQLISNLAARIYQNALRKITGTVMYTELLEVIDYFESNKNSANVTKVVNTTDPQTITVATGADGYVYRIFAIIKTSTPSIKIGTTSGGNEILDTTLISGLFEYNFNDYNETTRNIYITISGGTAYIRYEINNSFMK